MSHEDHRLRRLFTARSVAVVGASETGMRSRNAIEAMSKRGIDLHLVNRRGEEVLGRPTSRSLSELAEKGAAIDAAILFTNATAALDITAEAASLGVGGVVVNVGGFAETGPAGAQLQRLLVEAAEGMPVLGPNCNGLISPNLGLHLAGSPPDVPITAGRLAFVTHSGATMLPMAVAGAQRMVGFSYLVSTGNEAVVDMAEVVDYLASDDSTTAICLLIETIRRPGAFWDAIDRAIAAGKPVLALKNGRSQRGQAIAKSHTGAVAGEAWIYESALRQHGVILADDLVDLIDRATLFGQVPRERWSAVQGLAVASGSGGWVTMASDICAEEGIALPELSMLKDSIAAAVPGATVVNPLDLTGAAMTDPRVMASALETFVGSDDVDSVLMLSSLSEGSEVSRQNFVGAALEVAPRSDKLLVVGSIEGGPISKDLGAYLEQGIGVTRGLRASIRALRSMSDFVTFVPPVPRCDSNGPRSIDRPDATFTHPTAGPMLTFEASMRLLTECGVPVAPYVVLGEDDDPDTAPPPFGAPYVVKLADVPHRSDIGAVRIGVDDGDLRSVVEDLRALATRLGEPATVAIQPKYEIHSEMLVGIDATNELGPLLVCGLGGIFVEVFKQVSGRLAPIDPNQAEQMLAEVNVGGVLDGPRGTRPWPKDALVAVLGSVSALAASAHTWLASVDINPLALTSDGVVAVDALVLVREPLAATDTESSTTFHPNTLQEARGQ